MTTQAIILVTATRLPHIFNKTNISGIKQCDPHTQTDCYERLTHTKAHQEARCRAGVFLITMRDISRLLVASLSMVILLCCSFSLHFSMHFSTQCLAFSLCLTHRLNTSLKFIYILSKPLTATNYTREAAGSSASGLLNFRDTLTLL